MMLDKPQPKVPKNMAGSIDIKDRERLATEVTGIGSSSTSVSEDGVGGSLSMMFTQIPCSKVGQVI